ncbi:MAG: type 1 glutamine amidotransferase [Planctomycetota bacterium]
MFDQVHYLLLQVRNPDDPMAGHEVDCFIQALQCAPERLAVHDLIAGRPTPAELEENDCVLLGGSGDYSVAKGGPWLPAALEAMAELAEMDKPVFASCWGFQALALALGGEVVTDLERAEVGSRDLWLTDAGRADPVFGPLAEAGPLFHAQLGHQDIVERLPPGAVLLASSELTTNQAFRLEGRPVYCTQFHPELTRETLLDRLRTYTTYVEKIHGVPYWEFEARCGESPHTPALLTRFVEKIVLPRLEDGGDTQDDPHGP